MTHDEAIVLVNKWKNLPKNNDMERLCCATLVLLSLAIVSPKGAVELIEKYLRENDNPKEEKEELELSDVEEY